MQRKCAVNPVYAYFGDYFRFMHLKNMVQRKPFCNVRSVRETDGLCPASSFHFSQAPKSNWSNNSHNCSPRAFPLDIRPDSNNTWHLQSYAKYTPSVSTILAIYQLQLVINGIIHSINGVIRCYKYL